MKKADFLLEVKAELDNIKKQATKEEIGKLDFSTFKHYSSYSCIYGQMTGNFSSFRANEINEKVYSLVGFSTETIESYYIPFKQQHFNLFKEARFTALEKYLYMVLKPMHKKIIAYLKGDIQEIILK